MAMIKTVQPRKNRLRAYTAPLHKRHAMLAAHLSKELRKKYGKRSIPVRVGDTVLVTRGGFKGKKDKIIKVILSRYVVFIKGVVQKKANGKEAQRPIHPSNLEIIELETTDKKRVKALERK
jgi:large subunit ribosomal protein L24